MSTNSITLRHDGLIADQLSCLNCTASVMCPECLSKDLVVSKSDVDDEGESDGEGIYDSDDDGATDNDGESDGKDDVDDEAAFNQGDIVWAKCGKRLYPAKVVGKGDVPVQYHKQLFSVMSSSHGVVCWYGENRFSCVLMSNISILAESREDSSRAASPDILPMYNMALADLRND